MEGKEKKRKKYRLSSVFYIGIFASGIIMFSIFLILLSIKYVNNQNLLKEKEKIQEEYNYIKDIDADVNEGYYVVYADGEYALNMDGEIIVIY